MGLLIGAHDFGTALTGDWTQLSRQETRCPSRSSNGLNLHSLFQQIGSMALTLDFERP